MASGNMEKSPACVSSLVRAPSICCPVIVADIGCFPTWLKIPPKKQIIRVIKDEKGLYKNNVCLYIRITLQYDGYQHCTALQ
eukprot:m.89222 g.89222  ORF g.89222 m.89222 type:complete len:82 (+) comp8828_c0_seq2:1497-1742(+)